MLHNYVDETQFLAPIYAMTAQMAQASTPEDSAPITQGKKWIAETSPASNLPQVTPERESQHNLSVSSQESKTHRKGRPSTLLQ